MNDQNFDGREISNFFNGADYWLVAYALEYKCTIVTHEIPTNSTKKVKIPNVCNGLDLDCINPFEMLRREKAKFALEYS